MAPQKTMAVSQQQQQQQQQQALHQQTNGRASQGDQQTAKSKKRKGKQQLPQISSNNNSALAQHQQPKVAISDNKQQVTTTTTTTTTPNGKRADLPASKERIANINLVTQPSREAVLADKNNLQKHNQVSPLPVEESQKLTTSATSTTATKVSKTSPVVAPATVIAKQISTDDQDDIDAGIELDGSSNSGSSVKDSSEDNHQIKSTSVSPIMAQSSLVNETCDTIEKHAIEVSPMEQLAGSLCTEISPSKKFSLTTKQQLAANQKVIEADEQLLQQKLQSKQQRKSSLPQSSSNSSLNNSTSLMNTSNTSQQQQQPSGPGSANVSRVSNNISSSSNNTSIVAQSPTLCRICEQHVYQMERMMAEKSVYHKSCFRCYQCKIQLRIDNYSSHEGQVYCKAHHRQLFQPQVNLDNEDDVDIVAKSTSKVVDDYLLHRGRLSDLSFSFLQPKPEGIRKRQMIICENEPAELPKDVVRSDTKVDDGIDRLNLNLVNIKERFERGAAASSSDESAPSSAGVIIEKPSFNLKKTLLAFETKSVQSNDDEGNETKRVEKTERPVVRKLTNLNGFLNRQSSNESEPPTTKPLAVRRSESLMMRLKKYESRINGDQIANDEDSDSEDVNNNSGINDADKNIETNNVPKKLSTIDLSSLKSQWENGDISNRRLDNADNDVGATDGVSAGQVGDNSPLAEKNEELLRIRQQLASRKRSSGSSSSIKNIYENAIKEAQSQKTPVSRISDLSALNGFSTTEIQQQLLQNGSQNKQQSSTPVTPSKDHFQLNLSNKANKLRERFEQGLINNNSHDDSDENDGDNEPPAMTKLEQIRQEKLEDLSIFTEGEIRAREARNMFQQIDRRLSNGQNQGFQPSSRSLSSISASMQAKLQMKANASLDAATNDKSGSNGKSSSGNNLVNGESSKHLNQATPERQKPIRLINNVRT